MAALSELARHAGLHDTGLIPISDLEYFPEIRRICEGNVCRGYGASWACPPAVGTLEECRERCSRYDCMLLFTGRYELADSFDFEGMVEGMHNFKRSVEAFDMELKKYLTSYLLLSNEGCGRCRTCTWPDAPCRFPDRLYHSIEGYGFNVSWLAQRAGVKYNNGPNAVTYFGALLFRRNEKTLSH